MSRERINYKAMSDGQFRYELVNRLTRIESKVARGFEELGINTDKNADWLTVDDASLFVYVDTIGRSLSVLLTDMERAGATHEGSEYTIIHRGDEIGTVTYRKYRL